MERKIKKGYGLIFGLQITTLVIFILTIMIGCLPLYTKYTGRNVIVVRFYEIPLSILLIISLILNVGLIAFTSIYRKNLELDKKKYLLISLGAELFILISIIMWILIVHGQVGQYLERFGLLFYVGLIVVAIFTIWILFIVGLKFLSKDEIIDLNLLESQEEMMYRDPNNYYQDQINKSQVVNQNNVLNEHQEMIEKLKELKMLKDSGIITNSEYENKKVLLEN